MRDGFANAFAFLLVGCPTVKEIGDKPDTESGGTSDPDSGADSGAETSEGTAEASSGSDDGVLPDGTVDCAAINADDETVAGGPIGDLGFPPPCNPRVSGSANHMCCSDDPAAVGGALPDYVDKGIDGNVPIFSGFNNGIGTWGLCVRTADIPAGSGLNEPPVAGCPIPCNPTWSEDDIATVCGASRVCCQTQPLQPEDCIQDGDLWRPVTGHDIGDGTDWANGRHATHQDPGGTGCTTFAAGSGPGNDAWVDCIAQLAVANQRGVCMALQAGQVCPGDPVTGFVDACMQINMGLIPPPMPG